MAASESRAGLVVALASGSHFVTHAYFTLLPPIFGGSHRTSD